LICRDTADERWSCGIAFTKSWSMGRSEIERVGRLIILLIVINLVAITLQTVPEFETGYAAWFLGIELLSLLVFTFEYGLRMWVAVEYAPYLHSDGWKARLKYATSPVGVIDLLAVLPFWLAFALPAELKILLVFRVIRFLKLTRYSPGMRSLLDVLYAERRALFGCLVILIGATLVAATAMHIVERHVQPEKLPRSRERAYSSSMPVTCMP
jgi:voltage-gated potassium channel